MPQIEQAWQAHMKVYGADKVWRQLARHGTAVARCIVERLMRRQGLHGVRRGKVVRTTVSDSKAVCPQDKVNRQSRGEPIGYIPPAEVEANYHRQLTGQAATVAA